MSPQLPSNLAMAWTYVVTTAWAERGVITKFGDGLRPSEATARDAEPGDSLLRAVRACICRLPPQQRDVLQVDLKAGGCGSALQLATCLGTTLRSIYVARNQGRKRLGAGLQAQGHWFGAFESEWLFHTSEAEVAS